VIRNARPDDIDTIAELIRALAEYERLSHEAQFDVADLRDALFGARPYAEVLLAESSDEVVGFALFFHNFSTFLGKPGIYLEDLYVHPEHRGGGHGKALLAHLAGTAIARGCGRLEWSVLDWNEPSIAFYRSLGAAAMDDWTTYRLAGAPLRSLAGGSPRMPG
jgi:GNAT superfamily N-acetyltransferase